MVALDAENRMYQQPDVRRAFAELAQHRVDQERHVVVENFHHGDAVSGMHGPKRDFRPTGLALQQKRPRLLADAGELFRAVTHEVVGRGALEQLDQKVAGNVAAAGRQDGSGCFHKRLTGFAFLGTGHDHDGHRFPLVCPLGAILKFPPILPARPGYPLPRRTIMSPYPPEPTVAGQPPRGRNGQEQQQNRHKEDRNEAARVRDRRRRHGNHRFCAAARAAFSGNGRLFREMRGKTRFRTQRAQGLCLRQCEAFSLCRHVQRSDAGAVGLEQARARDERSRSLVQPLLLLPLAHGAAVRALSGNPAKTNLWS